MEAPSLTALLLDKMASSLPSPSTFPQSPVSNICDRTLSAALLTMGKFDLYVERKFPKGTISRTEVQHYFTL